MYSFDTSAILDGWVRYYPPASFPTFWTRMDDLVASGKFKASRQVLEELEERADDVFDWLKAHQAAAVIEIDANQFAIAKAIEADLPGWASKKKNGCDPFVIALAETKGWKVITGERLKKTLNPKKTGIPDVCGMRSVPCGSLVDVVTAEKWKF